jgi:short-chain 2-methylacyl-CoA dehydrogenase
MPPVARWQANHSLWKLQVTISNIVAKLYAGQVAKKATAMAIEWCGGVGFTRDLPVEKFYRDCMIGQIYEGTTNIQLQTIAKLLRPKYA